MVRDVTDITLQKLFTKVSSAYIVRVAGAFAVLMLNIIVTRSLGAETAGHFLLVVTFIIFSGTLLRFGTDNNLIKQLGRLEVSRDQGKIQSCFSGAFYLITILLIVFSLLALFNKDHLSLYLFNDLQKGYLIPLICLAIAFFAYLNLNSFSLIAIGRTSSGVFYKNLSPYLFFIGLVLLASLLVGEKAIARYGYEGCVLVLLLALLMAFLFSGIAVKRAGILYVAFKSNALNAMFCSSVFLFLISAMEMTVQFSGQLISAYWLNSTEIAFLSSAQRASMVISFALMSVNLVFGPVFSKLYYEQQYSDLRRTFHKSFFLLILISTPIFLVIFLNAARIMAVFGEDFRAAAQIFKILLIGQFVNVCTGPVSQMMIAINKERFFAIVVTISGLMTIVLTYLLVSQYQVTGAAVAVAISVAMQNLLILVVVLKKLNGLVRLKEG